MILFLKSLAIFVLNKEVWSFSIAKQLSLLSRSVHLDLGIFYEAFKGDLLWLHTPSFVSSVLASHYLAKFYAHVQLAAS